MTDSTVRPITMKRFLPQTPRPMTSGSTSEPMSVKTRRQRFEWPLMGSLWW